MSKLYRMVSNATDPSAALYLIWLIPLLFGVVNVSSVYSVSVKLNWFSARTPFFRFFFALKTVSPTAS